MRIKTTVSIIVIAVCLLFSGNKLKDVNKDTSIENGIRRTQEKILEVSLSEPSYEYLKSVTIYMLRKDTEEDGAVGTGIYLVNQKGYAYILTNRHVCGDDAVDKCYAVFKEGNIKLFPVAVSINEKVDLALWRTSEELPEKNPIKGVGTNLKIKDKVYSVGNYLAIPYVYTEGNVSLIMENSTLFNLPCAPGCSGSGVFNKDGYLVGVIYAGFNITPFQFDTSKILGVKLDRILAFLNNAEGENK